MRPLITIGAAAGFVALCGLIVVGGRSLDTAAVGVTLDEIEDVPEAMFDQSADAEADTPSDAGQDDTAPAPPSADGSTAGTQADLERVAPREPLSELSLALPPKRKKPAAPEDWKSTRLFNPVAASAGVVEAQGYRVALAGIEPTPPEEECTFEGKAWPCGAQARTAFRAWLRARAVQCVVPPEPDRQLISAECHVGKEDVAAWLVANGWARPVTGGPYAEAATKAEADRKGIFGPPPKRISVTINPTLPTSSIAPASDQPILTPSVEPAEMLDPDAGFPPPPAASQ